MMSLSSVVPFQSRADKYDFNNGMEILKCLLEDKCQLGHYQDFYIHFAILMSLVYILTK
jgi:hypothetical protein